MAVKTFGEEIVFAVEDALKSKKKGQILRPEIDIAKLRKKLHMTQKQFAESYHIKLETLRNWEQGKRFPDSVGMTYLACIAKHPNQMLAIVGE